MSGRPDTRAVSITAAGFEDGLGRRSVRFDREVGGMLECLHLRPELWAFEGSLRERADALTLLEDERFLSVRDIERGPQGLVVVSELIAGQRLSDIIEIRQREDSAAFGIDASLGFLLQTLPALATLHTLSFSHGTIAPDRILVTAASQIVLLDAIYGAALERLNLSRTTMWRDLGLLAPPFGGAPRFDPHDDVTQAAFCALLLAVGRPLESNGDPAALGPLVIEVRELAEIRAGRVFATRLQQFFAAALPLNGRVPSRSADEAAAEIEKLADMIGAENCHTAFAHFARFEAPAFTASSLEDAVEQDEEVEDELTDPPPEPVVAAVPPPPPRPAPPPAPIAREEKAPPPVVVAPPAAPKEVAPVAVTAPVDVPPAPPATIAPPPPVVPAVAAPQIAPVQPVQPPPPVAVAPVIRPAPLPPPLPPPAVAPIPPIPVAPPPQPIGIAPPTPQPFGKAPVTPSQPIGIAPPAPLRVRSEPPAGYTPAHAESEDSVRALPFVDRGPVEEPRRFPWKLAAAALIVIATGTFAARSFLQSEVTPAAVSEEAAPAEAAAATVPPAGAKGSLTVATQPSGARVSIDGKDVGVTPLKLEDVAPGRHTVAVTSGNATIRRTVRVEAGRPLALDIPVYSGWIVVFSPIPLEIASGGATLGNTETGRIVLPPGRHALTLTNKEFGYSARREVEIFPGEERPLNIEPKAFVNVNAHPWAEVWVDGKKAGDTPIANLPVLLGTRVFVFKHPQYGERRETVTITAKPEALSVDLTKS